ncbi:DUF1851 domain-containing protein [Massilia sp. PWRC2]|uniref:DUF1851 domain-containing protein n=1 Tax=Massilia sp. PWRC2 TaxID=2804626 RepID=UPI003CFAC311
MASLAEINEFWGWTGLHAVEVLGENDFGNLMLRGADGGYWWLCPQELCCQRVAPHRAALRQLSYNQQFLQHWYAPELTATARAALGPLAAGRKYCMTVPSAQGGAADAANLATAPWSLLLRCCGEVAEAFDDAL